MPQALRPRMLLALVLFLTPALAGAADLSHGDMYQTELVAEAQAREHLVVEPNPGGKTIEAIRIVTYDAIDQHDPWPGFVGVLHAKTQDYVVRRELLFNEGEHWTSELVAETERNLRANLFLTMAEIVAARGSAPDRVIALVVTKDLWSLRANVDFTLINSTLQSFTLEGTEQNLGGTNRKASVAIGQDLWTHSLGESLIDPRVGGSRVSALERAQVIVNRVSGLVEGGSAELQVQQPLYRLSAKWAWVVDLSLLRSEYRQPLGSGIATVTAQSTGESIPYEYLQSSYRLSAALTRSYGIDLKQNLSFGWRALVQRFELPADMPAFSAAGLADYSAHFLPLGQSAGILYGQYHLYTPRYDETLDLNAFAFTEQVQLGPDVTFDLGWANPIFGFSTAYLEPALSLGYTWRWGKPNGKDDDYFTLGLGGGARNEPGILGPDWINRKLTFGISNFSPTFGFFRIVTAAHLSRRWFDSSRTIETLGGDTALRGFPVGYFSGGSVVTANLELRTLPFRLSSIHVGGAVFYDTGDAFDDPSNFAWHSSVGAGIRVVFPEFNRDVLRLDVALPLESAAAISPVNFVLRFGQAF